MARGEVFVLLTLPLITAADANFQAVPGALLYAFEAGTTTPATLYKDAALSAPHEHPVEANSAGRFAAIFTGPKAVKVDIRTPAGISLPGFPVDRVGGDAATRLSDISALSTNESVIARADLDDGSVWTNDGTTGNDPQLADGVTVIADTDGRLWRRVLPATLDAARTINVEAGATGLQDALTEVERNTVISADASGYAEVEGARQTLVLPKARVDFEMRTLSSSALTAVRIDGPGRVPDRAAASPQFSRRVDTFTVTAGQTEFGLTALFGKPRRAHDLVVYEDGVLKEPETDNGGVGGSLGGHYQLNGDATAIVADNWTPTEGATVEVVHGYDLEFDVTDHAEEYVIGGMVKIESITCSGSEGYILSKNVWPIRNINGSRIIVRLNSMRVAPFDIGTISALAVRPLPSTIELRTDGSNDATRNIYVGTEVPLYFYQANLRFLDTWHDAVFLASLRGGHMGFVDGSATFGPKHLFWSRDGGGATYNNSFGGFAVEIIYYAAQGGDIQVHGALAVGGGTGLRGSGGYVEGNGFRSVGNRVGVSTEGGSRFNLPNAFIAGNGLDIDLQSEGDYVDMSGGTVGRPGDTHTTIRVRKGATLNAKNATLYGAIVVEHGGRVLAEGAGGSYTITHTLGTGVVSDAPNLADALGGGFFTGEATGALTALKIVNNLPELILEDADSGTTAKVGAASGNVYHVPHSEARDNHFGPTTDLSRFQMDTSAKTFLIDGDTIIGVRKTAVGTLLLSATSGTLPAPTGSITFADAANPTDAEFLKAIVELHDQVEELRARLGATSGHGLTSD